MKRYGHFKALTALATAALLLVAAAVGADGRSASARVAAERAAELGLGTRMAATLLLNGGFPSSWTEAAGGPVPPETLEWPLPGRRLGRGFGSDGGKHEAVDITAPEGTPVRCMAPGLVGYAGGELKGYGTTMLVLHPGGWVTLYAHLSKLGARPGQRLITGEVLGEVGNTGISRGSHLHFELIVRGVRVDPMKRMHGAPGGAKRISRNGPAPTPGVLSLRGLLYSMVNASSASASAPTVTTTL